MCIPSHSLRHPVFITSFPFSDRFVLSTTLLPLLCKFHYQWGHPHRPFLSTFPWWVLQQNGLSHGNPRKEIATQSLGSLFRNLLVDTTRNNLFLYYHPQPPPPAVNTHQLVKWLPSPSPRGEIILLLSWVASYEERLIRILFRHHPRLSVCA